jgi:predicted anti-sigma-YlaC factor YlaD
MCQPYRKLIARQISGEMTLAESRRLTSHLSICPACRVEVRFAEACSRRTENEVALHELGAPPDEPPQKAIQAVIFPENWWIFAAGSALLAITLILLR